MNDFNNHDAIGLVAILCSLLVIALLVAGVTGALMLSAKLVGWKGAAWMVPLVVRPRPRRWRNDGERVHRGDAVVLGFAIVAWVVLFVAGVFK